MRLFYRERNPGTSHKLSRESRAFNVKAVVSATPPRALASVYQKVTEKCLKQKAAFSKLFKRCQLGGKRGDHEHIKVRGFSLSRTDP